MLRRVTFRSMRGQRNFVPVYIVKSLPPRRVLVAEDEALVSMLIEEELTEAGYAVAGPFATCADAFAWLSLNSPDLAVLDHELRDGPCTDIASELRLRGIPFLALTGSRPEDLPAVLREAPTIMKPDGLGRLPGVLEAMLVG